jgi:hypothetical protein
MSTEETIARLLKNKICKDYVKDYAKRHNIELPKSNKEITEVSEKYVGKKIIVNGVFDNETFNNDKGKIIFVSAENTNYGVLFYNPENHPELHNLNGNIVYCEGYYITPNDSLIIELED